MSVNTEGVFMNQSILTVAWLTVAATSALCACEKKSPMRDGANTERGIERMRTDAHKAGEKGAAPAVGNANEAALLAPEPASTMKLSFPLDRSSAAPLKTGERMSGRAD